MTLTDLEALHSTVLKMDCHEFEMWLEKYCADVKEAFDVGYDEGYSHGNSDGYENGYSDVENA